MQPPEPEAADSPLPDLSQCEREPIHLSGAIQPHGCAIVCRLADWVVSDASSNAEAMLGFPDGTRFVGRRADEIVDPHTLHDLRNTLQGAMISGSAERLPNVALKAGGERFDIAIHASGDHAIIEATPHTGTDTTSTDPIILVKSMIGRIKQAPNLTRFLQTGARQLRSVTGYDRVMIYRFLPDGSGQVLAEALRPGLQPYLGLRYPASDIPAQARALYMRQWLRMIVDVGYTPVPILGQSSAEAPLDLSLSTLRSVSPVHLEYLRNMGSAATLTISLIVGDRLWGLIACHHEAPRRMAASTLAATELFGQLFSLQIEARERTEEQDHVTRGRAALDRLIAEMPVQETVFDNLARFEPLLRDLVSCDGVGLWASGRFTGAGAVPPTSAIPALIDLLDGGKARDLYVTDMLSQDLPLAATFADRASGVIAIPFWRNTRDYLMFFRREIVETVAWGGNPNKPVTVGPEGGRIGPRTSFETWREIVRGRATPWRRAEIDTAASLRVSLLDVIMRRADLLELERKSAQESQSLIIAELNHRVKNTLALIRSLVRQSRLGAPTLESFTSDLEHRIRALAFAHDQLTLVGWRGAPLRRLIEAEVEAWAGGAARRVTLSGPEVTLNSRAYQALALVFHEMMTNAAKYGALSRPEGLLTISWALEPQGDLALAWDETGGPEVRMPERRGFGSVIMEQTIPFELQGDSRIEYRPDGVRGRFRIPAIHVVSVDPVAALPERAAPEPAQDKDADFDGKRLLLVEDSMMIALDAQAMLSDVRLDVEIASNVADAMRALAVNAFDLAVLDINLAGETSFPVAQALRAADVPFVFATGYGENVVVPDLFSAVEIVSKPYDARSLSKALARSRL